MKEIILVRHGESIMNKNNAFCGWTNSELTDVGISQAREACKKLQNDHIDLIISSDLSRCLETAKIINDYQNIEIIREKEFRELNFGKWEGLCYGDISSGFPKEVEAWEKDYVNYIVPEGESLSQMYKRATKAFYRVINSHDCEKILIVSHSGIIRAILSDLISNNIDSYWKFKIINCGITRIEFIDEFPILTAMNQ